MSVGASSHVRQLIELALDEDIGPGDVTTNALVDPDVQGRAVVLAREPMVLSGLEVAAQVFRHLDPALRVSIGRPDGASVLADDVFIEVEGRLASILTAERTALNFLQRLCGVATQARRYVDALAGSNTRLLDTRKTTPGWRLLEKEAVRHGGGTNHRFALFDGVLIKDNHLAVVGDVTEAVRRAKARAPRLVKVEIEVEDLEGLKQAIAAGADMVLLDNMDDDLLRRAVEVAAGRVPLEASGGITLERLPRIAQTGVDFVSSGAVTHGARAMDVSLEMT